MPRVFDRGERLRRASSGHLRWAPIRFLESGCTDPEAARSLGALARGFRYAQLHRHAELNPPPPVAIAPARADTLAMKL
jgi:hypothetical protein